MSHIIYIWQITKTHIIQGHDTTGLGNGLYAALSNFALVECTSTFFRNLFQSLAIV